MRIHHLVLLIALAAGCSEAKIEGQNSFGFTIDVPDNWWVMSRQDTGSISDGIEETAVEGLSPELLKQCREQMKSGMVEFYFRHPSGLFPDFTDNVNIQENNQRMPQTDEHLQEFREAIPGEFAKMFGKPIDLIECKFADVGGKKALYIEFEGVGPNLRNLQYHIPKSSRKVIIITATCMNDTLDDVRAEFEQMIASIRFP